jgi:dihydroorotate dehydrogenase
LRLATTKGPYILESLSRLGFGYIVVGTITRKERVDNPKPRVVRRPSEMASVNAMGFPNTGLEKFAEKLSRSRVSCPVVASIADEDPERLDECYATVQEHASAVEVNISSPQHARAQEVLSARTLQGLSGIPLRG